MKQNQSSAVLLFAPILLFKGELAHAAQVNPMAQWFGNFHFIFVHFPIALIVLACAAELLFTWKKDPRYGFVVNFLLVSATIFVVPTVLSGLSLAGGTGGEEIHSTLEWHETFGIITLSLTLLTLFLKNARTSRPLYLLSLILLLASVIVTAYLGGLMAFGEISFLPPI